MTHVNVVKFIFDLESQRTFNINRFEDSFVFPPFKTFIDHIKKILLKREFFSTSNEMFLFQTH